MLVLSYSYCLLCLVVFFIFFFFIKENEICDKHLFFFPSLIFFFERENNSIYNSHLTKIPPHSVAKNKMDINPQRLYFAVDS